jgi:hypothetical protein
MIETGTVYHFFEPTLIDGSTTSPNMSRGTGLFLLESSSAGLAAGARLRIIQYP